MKKKTAQKAKIIRRPSTRDNEIRQLVRDLHRSYLPDNKSMKRCAKETEVPLSTIQQATSTAKGSLETHISIFLNQTGLNISNLRDMLHEVRKISKEAPKYSLLQEKLEAVLSKYSVDQVIIIFELMLAKDKVESSLGLNKKPGRPKSQKK